MPKPLASRIAEMAREADTSTNLHANPLRYSDPRSVYAGTPSLPGVGGAVYEDKPHEVFLRDDWIADPHAASVLAHEGTHSKLLQAGKRKAPASIKPAILNMLKRDPEFLRKYTGYDVPFDHMSREDQEYLMQDDEILARLNSIEASLPSGTMLENSTYARDLFSTPGSTDDYLDAVVPEGYLRNDKPFTETPNLTTARPASSGRDALWRAINRFLK